jgi:hypothetical protein
MTRRAAGHEGLRILASWTAEAPALRPNAAASE